MKQVFVADLLKEQHMNAAVSLQGWLSARRSSKGLFFLDITDSTGLIQAVFEQDKVTAEVFALAATVPLESAVLVVGSLSQHQNRRREIAASELQVIGPATLQISPRPRERFAIFDQKMADHVLTNRHLYLRNPKIMAILQFRSLMMSCVRQWFEKNRYTEIDAPILTALPLYEDGSAISLDINGEKVFLTQCVGYYLEAAVHAFERVYNMGPSFRGEESHSPRHLMEYHHIKAEVAFTDLEGIIRMVESLIQHITETCWDKGGHLLQSLETNMCLHGLNGPFERITYEDAVEQLRKKGFEIEFGKGLGGREEAELSKLFKGPFWVTGIPRVIEPFPYSLDAANPKITKVADLIASNGFGELLGTAEKIHELPMLDERMAEKGKAGDPRYEWIREVHQLGCVPHAAFGMGVERMIRWLLNIPHVRDAIPFPRTFRRRIAP